MSLQQANLSTVMPNDCDLSSDAISYLRGLSDDAEFFSDLGRTFSKHKHFALAKAAFDIALQLDPNDAFTHLRLGNWYYREHQLEAALERFEYANQLRPDLPATYWGQADIFETLQRFDEAEELHRRAVAADRSDRQAKRLYREFRWRREQTDY